MADLITDVNAALKTQLATISGLNAHAEQPDTVNVPAAWPRFSRINYDQSMSGDVVLVYEVALLVSPFQHGMALGQQKAWPYLAPTGASSIKAVLEAAPTLGGVSDQVIVSAARDLNSYEINDIEYIGAIVDIEIWA